MAIAYLKTRYHVTFPDFTNKVFVHTFKFDDSQMSISRAMDDRGKWVFISQESMRHFGARTLSIDLVRNKSGKPSTVRLMSNHLEGDGELIGSVRAWRKNRTLRNEDVMLAILEDHNMPESVVFSVMNGVDQYE